MVKRTLKPDELKEWEEGLEAWLATEVVDHESTDESPPPLALAPRQRARQLTTAKLKGR